MSVYFTSDLHLGHKLASDLRGFDSVEEHDNTILEALNKTLSKKDKLFILGDVSLSSDTSKILELKKLPGIKTLVRGNHDDLSESLYRDIFNEIHGFLNYKKFWLSHCPIHPNEVVYRRGNIHGHIHKSAAYPKVGLHPSPYLDMPYFNVNWDFWKRPLNFEEIQHGFILWENK